MAADPALNAIRPVGGRNGVIAPGHRRRWNKVLVRAAGAWDTAAMELIIRKASVRWVSGGGGGTRTATTESGALTSVPLSLGQVRRNYHTNAAELLAAAHAGSFSLALADEFQTAAVGGGEILVSAAVTMQHLAAGWTITNIHVTVAARLSRLSQGEFIDATVRAKTKCLISRALRPTVSMNAKLETG